MLSDSYNECVFFDMNVGAVGAENGASYILVNLETNSEKYYNPDSGRKIESAPARMPAASDKMRMIYCYCFKPNGDKIKFW